MQTQLSLLSVCLFVSIIMSKSVRADVECRSANNAGPCYSDYDAWVREDFAASKYPNVTMITPQIVANDLNINPPSWKSTQAQYQIFVNHKSPNGRLLIFAPGQPDLPQHYQWLAARAAYNGYNVVVIHYWNDKDDASVERCKDPPNVRVDDSCVTGLYEGWFRNIGALTPAHANTPTGSNLVEADQFRHRLRKLLRYLGNHFPKQNWKKFAQDNSGGFDTAPFIDWSLVTVAGHSSGSKLVAHIAKEVKVRRVILFSGPSAYYEPASGGTSCSSSIAPIGATPASSYYVYYNTNDTKANIMESCHQALGLNALGRYSINDGYAALNAHVIYNNALAQSSCDNGQASSTSSHLSTAENCALSAAPYGNLLPAHFSTYAIWDYLFTR